MVGRFDEVTRVTGNPETTSVVDGLESGKAAALEGPGSAGGEKSTARVSASSA